MSRKMLEMKILRKEKEVVKKFGKKMQVGRVKSEKWSFEGCGYGDGKKRRERKLEDEK